MTDRLTLIRPDDWHIHLRDGAVLQHTFATQYEIVERQKIEIQILKAGVPRYDFKDQWKTSILRGLARQICRL